MASVEGLKEAVRTACNTGEVGLSFLREADEENTAVSAVLGYIAGSLTKIQYGDLGQLWNNTIEPLGAAREAVRDSTDQFLAQLPPDTTNDVAQRTVAGMLRATNALESQGVDSSMVHQLLRPDHAEEITALVDHLNAAKEIAARLSGVTSAAAGQIKAIDMLVSNSVEAGRQYADEMM